MSRGVSRKNDFCELSPFEYGVGLTVSDVASTFSNDFNKSMLPLLSRYKKLEKFSKNTAFCT